MPALGPINHKRAPAEDPAISSTMEKLRVEYWPIQRLKPYDRNPRKNDKAALAGATCAPRAPTRAFFAVFRSSAAAGEVPVSVVDVMMLFSFRGITAVTTSITPMHRNCK